MLSPGGIKSRPINNKDKKTAWDTWKVYENVTPAFATLSNNPNTEAVYESLPLLERFVFLMDDRTTNCVSVNEARLDLFPQEPE